MEKLKSYSLDFERTLDFFSENLRDVNTLSCEFLNIVDFHSGSFFTLLPEHAHMEKIYDFENGGVLPQNPSKRYSTGPGTFTLIPSIKKELSKLISRKIASNGSNVCIFDDVSRTAEDPGLEDFQMKKGLFTVEREMYYILTKENNSFAFTEQLLLQSFTFWHTFALITNGNAFLYDRNIWSLETLKSICKTAQIAFVGAYDGEGYIFWKTKETEAFDLHL